LRAIAVYTVKAKAILISGTYAKIAKPLAAVITIILKRV
jgi:hypothetical protein